jgi:uncharacterized lipoprotein YmbA
LKVPAGIRGALALALVSAVVGGCTLRAAPPKTFVLSAASPAATSPPAAGRGPVVGVGPVGVPAYLDRPAIVARAGSDEVRLSSDHHWAEPLKDGVARVVAENLSIMVPTEAVALFPWRGLWAVKYRVTLEILRFDGPLGGPVVLNARWRLLDGEGKELALRAVALSEPVTEAGYPALVAAQSRMLAAVSRDIAAEIRARP